MESTNTEQIAAKLRAFIRDRYKVPESDPDFNDDTHLFDYGYVDSFGAVDLTTYVETAFGTKISESDLIAYPLNTINEISTFVFNRLQPKR